MLFGPPECFEPGCVGSRHWFNQCPNTPARRAARDAEFQRALDNIQLASELPSVFQQIKTKT